MTMTACRKMVFDYCLKLLTGLTNWSVMSPLVKVADLSNLRAAQRELRIK
jgi:hypothetical protein